MEELKDVTAPRVSGADWMVEIHGMMTGVFGGEWACYVSPSFSQGFSSYSQLVLSPGSASTTHCKYFKKRCIRTEHSRLFPRQYSLVNTVDYFCSVCTVSGVRSHLEMAWGGYEPPCLHWG